ncbi:hypothetical protein EASAB2608_00115 [Streptomyces sp. EAS-AB2608]|nr:hypothetical protein EASAB2608_00115 [Streptomyces sp. EAS-AB2608]CUW32704.1 Carbamate kinase 1 [Streptomyces reticuli]
MAETPARDRGRHIARDTTGWRRVVASPAPERILETDTIHELLNSAILVLCAGGGGIPVTADRDTGALTGAEAAVDKALTAALLAEDLKADVLLILTDVPCVYDGYGTCAQHPLLDATPRELRHGGFPAGSMGPRTEAAARCVEHTDALDAAPESVHGGSGTLIRPDITVG